MDIIAHPDTAAQTGLNDPILTSLERYWRSLRHARHIPVRNDLNPSKIDHALPYAFILQRVAPGTARFRVAGQRVHDMIKMDARGMPFSTLFHPECRDDIASLIETAFGEPAIMGLPLVSAGAFMRPKLHGAMLLLPMQDDAGETNRLLGAFVTPDVAQTRPRRFEINTGEKLRHESLGLRLAATPLHHPAPAQSKRPDASQHPALRLVVNNG
jgi:hypothetical protein